MIQEVIEEITRSIEAVTKRVRKLEIQEGMDGSGTITIIADVMSLIILYHASGDPVEYFEVSDAGLAAAVAASFNGDDIVIPPHTSFINDYTVPINVSFIGASSVATRFTGLITLNDESYLRDLSVIRDANDAGVLIGIIGPAVGKAYLNYISVTCTQNGVGNAIGLDMGVGDMDVRESYFYGDAAVGNGYGVDGGAGDCNLSAGCWVRGTTAIINGSNIYGITFDHYIKLIDASGTLIGIFAPTESGLSNANTTGASGDALYLPTGTFAGDLTITDGLKVVGISRYATILSGQITGGDDASVENLSIIRSANSVDILKGVVVVGADTFYAHSCDIEVTQLGSGNAYGVSVEADSAIMECWNCYLYGSSYSGLGYGGYRNPGTTANLYVFGGRANGSTGAFSE